jgi:hypothetical protein
MRSFIPGLSSFYSLFDDFTKQAIQLREKQEEDKRRIINEWRDSARLPRKKKKLRRKQLAVDWSIANYDCFWGMSNEELQEATDCMRQIIFGKGKAA